MPDTRGSKKKDGASASAASDELDEMTIPDAIYKLSSNYNQLLTKCNGFTNIFKQQKEEIGELNKQLEAATCENTQLQAKCTSLDEKLSQGIGELNKQLSAAKSENETLKVQYTTLENKCSSLEDELAKVKNILADYMSKTSDLEAEVKLNMETMENKVEKKVKDSTEEISVKIADEMTKATQNLKVIKDDVKDIANEVVDTHKAHLLSVVEEKVKLSYASAVKSVENKKQISNIVQEVVKANDQDVKRQLSAVKLRQEAADRALNVIMFNVKETEEKDRGARNANDRARVEKILKEMKIHDKVQVVSASRLGKYVGTSQKPRPIRFTVKEESQRMLVLTSGKELKESGIANHVYVSKDLSKEERDLQKNVLTLLRERRTQNPTKQYIIYRGKVVEKGTFGPSTPTDTQI